MWEWTFDKHDGGWYGGAGKSCVNCANVSSGYDRVLRGGGFADAGNSQRAADRYPVLPTLADPTTGFRCARSL